ncbi:MAG: Fic family protein [Acidobacteria bacterium]|nr:Fic family protein [Acidobacteriota bacterium]
MQRDATGGYAVVQVEGEEVRAFVPDPLPPAPPLAIDGGVPRALEAAAAALGRLDAFGAAAHPDAAALGYACVRQEAIGSSRIEGIDVPLEALLRVEVDGPSSTTGDDVLEVANHVRAIEQGLGQLRQDRAVSNRLLRELHAVLLDSPRGQRKMPGAFRRAQNWIGGPHPLSARYVPPPPAEVENCMAALERFVHAADDRLPLLARTALAHAQFESIHPFLDGNGRVGRLLVTLMLRDLGLLREAVLPISAFLYRHRMAYYDLLNTVTATGNWEDWLEYFLEGVRAAADGTVALAGRMAELFAADRRRIDDVGRRMRSAARVHQALMAQPVVSIPVLRQRAEISFPAAANAIELLTEMGITRQISVGARNRIFAYEAYLKLLGETD